MKTSVAGTLRGVVGVRLLSASVFLCCGVALAAPPALEQSACGRGTNASTGDVTLPGPIVPGERLLLAIWWSGTIAEVSSVTDSLGGTWRALTPKLSLASADPFSVALYESVVVDGGSPLVTVTMDSAPMGAGFNLIDLTLLEFSGVAELGATSWAMDAGATVLAGPVDTVVPDELIVAYVGANSVITSANDGLVTAIDCFGDLSATRVAPAPGSWGGTFTGSSSMDWASVTVALRPVAADAGTPADAGVTEPDARAKHYLVGCASTDAACLIWAALLIARRRRGQRLP